jgi:cellulose biosynthesis protein BcsQ
MAAVQDIERPDARATSKGATVARVIALANQKGGVAKTTSTLNLAVAFAEKGHKVLAVDLDPQGNLTMSQGLNPDTIERSMYDVLVHKLPIEQVVYKGEIDLSLRGLVQLENTLSMIRENLNPEVEIEGILATMYDSRTLHSREALEILEENFGNLVFKTRIRKTIRYAEAPVKGSSILKYDPTGTAAQAYRDLAKEVLNGAKARKHA